MITYVNEKQVELFTQLGDVINRPIENIRQYLDAISDGLPALPSKFVRLPIDEDVFEIDANARVITVPKGSFAKNGVGVVGDELAEIVYFKINRYFDVADFGSADMSIYIQWENASGEKGVSKAYAIDKESDPDYIYFGWALTTAITKKAGNIKFNVRIFKIDTDRTGEKVLGYSFSTQAATVAIKAGLDFDVLDSKLYVEDVADEINARLLKGNIAHAPIFTTNLETFLLTLGENGSAVSVAVSQPEDEPAYDNIVFKWYKDGVLIPEAHGATYTIPEAGRYWVVAYGSREIVDAVEVNSEGQTVDFEYHTSVASKQSNIITVPLATALVVVKDLYDENGVDIDHIVIHEGAEMNYQLKPQTIEIMEDGATVARRISTIGAQLEKVDGNRGELLSAESLAEATFVNANTIITETVPAEEEGGEPSSVEVEVMPVSIDDESGLISYEVSDVRIPEGYYRISTFNTVNNVTLPSEPAHSRVCRITGLPTLPTEVRAQVYTINGNPSTLPSGGRSPSAKKHMLKAVYTIDGLSDDAIVKWYEVYGDTKDPEIESDAAEGSEPIFNDKEVTPNPETPAGFYAPERAGTYYFKVLNVVNGVQSEFVSSDEIAFTSSDE